MLWKRLQQLVKLPVQYWKTSVLGLLILLSIYWFSLPTPLFKQPTSTVLLDQEGRLLGARIANDGQWRFPAIKQVPEKFKKALLTFEDRRFYSHPGVDPISLGRALYQNLSQGKIVSGGSTISMQVIRLALNKGKRTIWRKMVETVLATRLELQYSKEEILQLYASNAPFGGNVVGLEAASWRYFGKDPSYLSWAESTMLAVLPNSPGLIHPSKNRDQLLAKRNRLLSKLLEHQILDSLSCQLAQAEPLPQAPLPLPRIAPHLLERFHQKYSKESQSRIQSTIDYNLQQQLNKIISKRQQMMQYNEVYNLAALIIDIDEGTIVAYTGNAPNIGPDHSEQVDIITAPRSTGSILKPFLYALMLEDGEISPYSIIPDIPTQLSGYRPENFSETYEGVVPAKKALIRSLNIPMVRMLQQHGLEKFHFELQQLGLQSINKDPSHYGLTLILGGAEATLEEITNAYAGMARLVKFYPDRDGWYSTTDFRKLQYIKEEVDSSGNHLRAEPIVMGAAAAWLTLEAMEKVERPTSEGEWQSFQSSQKIAWKTGTSYGYRDAWAIGVNPRYAVGVWAGNADGEGRPGLVGVLAAAPVLFDIFRLLPTNEWFEQPYDDFIPIVTCAQSGYKALPMCPKDTIYGPSLGLHLKGCPNHKTIHLDTTSTWRVHDQCENPIHIKAQRWFLLPPVEEFYYKVRHPSYLELPPYREDCKIVKEMDNPMQLIYPKQLTKILVPLDLNGLPSRTVFKIAHRDPSTTIHWHIDQAYIGSTKNFHQMELNPPVGKHLLTLVDIEGNRLQQKFEIISK